MRRLTKSPMLRYCVALLAVGLSAATGANLANAEVPAANTGASSAQSERPALPSADVIEKLIKAEIEAFRVAFASGDFKTFHARGSSSFRNAVTAEELDKKLRPMIGAFEPLSVVGPLKPIFLEPPHIDDNGTLILRGHFDDAKYVITYTIDMVMDQGEWRFQQSNVRHDTQPRKQTASEPIPPEKRLPLPPADEVEKLLRAHLELFNVALATGNFEDIYAKGSRSLRNTSSVNEMKDALGPLIGKFGALSSIGGIAPEFSEPPHVNDFGYLIMRGHFKASGGNVAFTVELEPDDGVWRYSNINVDVN